MLKLIKILKDQNIGTDKDTLKFTDKENMQICLSESNGQITDLIDYTQTSNQQNNYLNFLLPNATFHYMCRYTGSTGSALLQNYDQINNSDKIKNTTNSDKVKLFYYGTDQENPAQLKFYSNHDDYYNYITLDNTENLKTPSDVKFIYMTNYIQQFSTMYKLLIDILHNTLQLDELNKQLNTAEKNN